MHGRDYHDRCLEREFKLLLDVQDACTCSNFWKTLSHTLGQTLVTQEPGLYRCKRPSLLLTRAGYKMYKDPHRIMILQSFERAAVPNIPDLHFSYFSARTHITLENVVGRKVK